MTKKKKHDVSDLFSKLAPASNLTKAERIQWNEWKLSLYVLADKARDASHLNDQRGSVFKSPQGQELVELVNQIPMLEIDRPKE